MLKLLYKELRLAAHPTLYVFMALGLLVLIPSYPYSVTFLYGCLAPFITLFYGRETNDIYYTALLPVRKSAVVAGKCLITITAQLGLLLVSVPAALLSARINPLGGNTVGIDANVAFYGFGLFIFAVYNLIFLTGFFKTAYKMGRPFILAITPAALLMVAMEVAVHLPSLEWLDGTAPDALVRQLSVLALGAAAYALGMLATWKISAGRFEAVDL